MYTSDPRRTTKGHAEKRCIKLRVISCDFVDHFALPASNLRYPLNRQRCQHLGCGVAALPGAIGDADATIGAAGQVQPSGTKRLQRIDMREMPNIVLRVRARPAIDSAPQRLGANA